MFLPLPAWRAPVMCLSLCGFSSHWPLSPCVVPTLSSSCVLGAGKAPSPSHPSSGWQ